jgi:hypothetical protein
VKLLIHNARGGLLVGRLVVCLLQFLIEHKFLSCKLKIGSGELNQGPGKSQLSNTGLNGLIPIPIEGTGTGGSIFTTHKINF